MAPIAVVEIVVISIYFSLPTVPGGIPWNKAFSWQAVQYAPIAMIVIVGGAMIWWFASARKWFTGPVRTIDSM